MVKEYSIKRCTSTRMDCSGNNIKALDKYAFKTINCKTNSLKWLSLYNNDITEVLNVHFSTLINLTHIYLNSNKIITVNRLLFVNNKKLEYINLSYNLIKTNFFLNIDALSSLQYLDLGYNSLSLLNQSVFENYIKQVTKDNTRKLVISGSNFRCGFDMKWISDLENIIFIPITYLDTDKCMPCLLFNQKCAVNNIVMRDKGWII